jgi:endonuclease III
MAKARSERGSGAPESGRRTSTRAARLTAARSAARVTASGAQESALRRASTPKERPAARRTRESHAERAARAARILKKLHALNPDATCALHHRNPYELLTAVILSAQCTDERVNQVTPALFRRYPTPEALAKADEAELQSLIQSTGFFRNKAKSLRGMATRVSNEHGGRIPATMDELLALPGVARKTANVILGTAYGQNVGIVVDTHVGRVSLRLRLLTSARNDKDAVRIEQDLMKLFPRDEWTFLAHALIQHGRQICTARAPKCSQCPLARECPSAFEFEVVR